MSTEETKKDYNNSAPVDLLVPQKDIALSENPVSNDSRGLYALAFGTIMNVSAESRGAQTKVDGLTANVAGLTAKVDGLTANTNNNNDRLSKLEDKIDILIINSHTNNDILCKLETNFIVLASKLDANNDILTKVELKVDDLATNIVDLTASINTNNTSIVALSTEVASYNKFLIGTFIAVTILVIKTFLNI
ncbi:MAG: hypothetical protein LBT38_09405 [Deltaproteobacteria bacterium]|jgi:peptidoglycan hydrolase CwlO-like protein|nr:hypothetical protein [Deltaproteobacteria bacterium]